MEQLSHIYSVVIFGYQLKYLRYRKLISLILQLNVYKMAVLLVKFLDNNHEDTFFSV